MFTLGCSPILGRIVWVAVAATKSVW
jgi:hypothetical protein